jgi:hypothetical protein
MFASHAALMTATSKAPTNPWALLHFDNSIANAGDGGSWTFGGTYNSSPAKFGSHSAAVSGGSPAYSSSSLTIPSQFTAECWFYPNTLSQTAGIIGTQLQGSYVSFCLFQVNSAIQWNIGNADLSGWSVVSSGGTVNNVSWNHLAISGDGTNVKVFLNGTQLTSTSQPSWSYSKPVYIGNYGGSGSYGLSGYVDEFRLDRLCQYTGNFTPPSAAFS